jgi:hypothetical protein
LTDATYIELVMQMAVEKEVVGFTERLGLERFR